MNLLPGRRPRVTFLTFNVHGIGGIARVVINVANALATTHDVEILSILRSNPTSTFPIDERVVVSTLFDATRAGKRRRNQNSASPRVKLAGEPAADPVLSREPKMNALIERRLRRRLATTDADVVISTRPSLHWAAVRMTRPHVGLIGWDHLNFPTRYGGARMGRLLDEVVPQLDAWVTLTEEDRTDYLSRLGEQAPRVEVLRNSSGWVAPVERPARRARVVVGAGRLEARKGFDRAIEAWRPLAASHPDWQLHIYGSGPLERELKEQVAAAGLQDVVRLMGYTKDFQQVLANADLFLMTSRAEGFPMVLVEAMSQGTPIVSLDCPRGPAEIVTSGRNGELVDDGDIPGVTAALDKLLNDDELRRRLGEQAMADSREYQMDNIVARWTELIEAVGRPGASRRAARRAVSRPVHALRRLRRG